MVTPVKGEQKTADERACRSYQRRAGVAVACVDGQTSEKCSHRIADVESDLRKRRAEHFSSAGILEQKHLLRRGNAEQAGRAEEKKSQRKYQIFSGEEEAEKADGHDSLHA